jgi:hypothetical protein
MPDQDDLEALSRKGKAELAQREARHLVRKERRERLKRAKIQLIAECSTTPLGWLSTGEVSMLGPLGILGVASLLAGKDYPRVLQGAVAFHALLFLLLMISRLQGKQGWARETKWAGSLPFALDGYLANLGDLSQRTFAPHTSGPSLKFTMVLHFQGDLPKDPEAIVAGFDAKLSVSKKDPRSIQVTHGDFPGGATNYPLHRFIHRFVDQVALPLHAQTPLSRLDVLLKT